MNTFCIKSKLRPGTELPKSYKFLNFLPRKGSLFYFNESFVVFSLQVHGLTLIYDKAPPIKGARLDNLNK